MQINRLFEIVYLLLQKKTLTAAELAERFEVSVRTVYRDVELLSQSGIPIYASKGKGGGIRLADNFVLSKSLLSKDEQDSILHALVGAGAAKMTDSKPLLDKLSAVFDAPSNEWIEIDFSTWYTGSGVSAKFDTMKEAILSCKMVRFDYSSLKGKTESRQVEPCRLVFRSNSWYLLGWCTTREDFRYFKLARMNDIVDTDVRFTMRTPPESQQSSQPYQQTMVELLVHISSDSGYRVFEEFCPEQVTTLPDGSFSATFSMPENAMLYSYLLSYGSDIKVLEPRRIQKELVKKLKLTIKQYKI